MLWKNKRMLKLFCMRQWEVGTKGGGEGRSIREELKRWCGRNNAVFSKTFHFPSGTTYCSIPQLPLQLRGAIWLSFGQWNVDRNNICHFQPWPLRHPAWFSIPKYSHSFPCLPAGCRRSKGELWDGTTREKIWFLDHDIRLSFKCLTELWYG